MSHATIETAATDPEEQAGNYKWLLVAMLWFICFFNYADRQAIAAVLPVLEQEFGFNKEQQGYITSAFMWMYALTAPLAGPVGDRFNRKYLILGGLYVWSAITGLTALCSRFWHFVLVRGAEGLGETFYFPASMSLVSDYHSSRTRSRAMGIHQTSVYAGIVGGSAIAGYMADRLNWWSPFLFLAGGGMFLGTILWLFVRDPRATRRAAGVDQEPPAPFNEFLRDVARTPTALCLVVIFLGTTAVSMIFLTWMPTYLKGKFGLSLASAGLQGTVFLQSASMLGAMTSGVLADRLARTMPGGRVLVQSAGLLWGAPFILVCGLTTDLTLVNIATFCFGFGKGLYDGNIWASIYDVIPVSRRSTTVGWMNCFGFVGGASGPVIIGAVVDRGISMGTALASTAVIYATLGTLMVVTSLVLAPKDVRRNLDQAALNPLA